MLLSRLPLRIATALDLHVLGLPPAFALSQDQTLKFGLRTFTRLITTFDEVRHFFHARTCALQVLHLKPARRLHENSVDLET